MPVTLSLLAGAGQQFFDNNGVMLTGGKLFTYLAGTTTPYATYTSAAGNVAHTNPIILDAAGRVPGGEIWLTLGVGYKFVLKTSTDILIATYDNIPSSALPPAANDADSIMYEQGYTVTAGSFVVGQTYRIVSVGTTDFTLIGATSNTPGVHFIATGAGTGTGTAESSQTVENKLRQIVSFKDFGAVGDGVTNDAAAVLTALNSGAKVIDGQGLTYRLLSNIAPTCENIIIQNATFDISQITTGGSALDFAGTQGTGALLTANTLTGSNAVAIGSTSGFAADDYAWMASTAIFDVGASVVLGQIVKIKSVDSATAMTLYDDVLYDFTTAASASIAKLTPKKNITLSNMKFIGAGTGIQTALDFNKCVDVLVQDCSLDYVDYTSILFDRCVNATVTSTSMRYARSVGLSYGVVVANGCYNVKVANSYGEDQRHFVTVGDNDGVNLFVNVTNCHAAMQRDAGLDSHAAGDFILFDGNTIEGTEGQKDGIICQGLNCVITNNIIVGNISSGIRHQILPSIGTASCVISGNSIRNFGTPLASSTAIQIEQNSGGASVNGVNISNNIMSGTFDYGVFVYAETGNIKNVTINGNVTSDAATNTACFLRALAGYSLEDFAITGNVFKSSGVQNIYLLGTTTPNVLNGTISGNVIKGGTNGIRMIQTQNVMETGNYNTGVTRKVFVDTGSSVVWLDRRQSSIVTMTNSTYVVLDQDEQLIANRASTITVTLPAAASWPGRVLRFKTIQAQAVDSNASNVVPIGDSAAGTSILPATDGAWAWLQSDGTNWVITARG
jgi:hypothetical protein